MTTDKIQFTKEKETMLMTLSGRATQSQWKNTILRDPHQMQQNEIDEQLLQIVQQAFERELESTHINLSRPERVSLYQEAAKSILSKTIEKIEDTK